MKTSWGPIVILLVYLFTIYDAGAFEVWSPYQKMKNILNTVNNQDRYWKFVLSQNVYYSLDSIYFKRIVNDELLVNAIDESGEVSCESKGKPIKTDQFLKNLLEKRYVIGSLLEMGLRMVQKAQKCLAYKNSIHLMTLIRVEITRKMAQKRAVKWSQRAKAAMSEIVMQMGGLQYMDSILLQAIKFLSFFNQEKQTMDVYKFKMISYLDNLIEEMLNYLQCNCVKAPKNAEEVAKELKVITIPDLYSSSMSKNITDDKFKKMFVSSMEKIEQHFGGTQIQVSMHKTKWNEILNFMTVQGVKEKFIQIDN